MKIGQEYLKQILNAFIDAPRSFVWVADIVQTGIDIDDRFLFHLQILEGQGFVECLDKKSGLGYEITLGGQNAAAGIRRKAARQVPAAVTPARAA